MSNTSVESIDLNKRLFTTLLNYKGIYTWSRIPLLAINDLPIISVIYHAAMKVIKG